MSDVHGPDARSRNMRAIRSKDTKPELLVQGVLHSAGIEIRLGGEGLPGSPDIVLPKFRVAIFVHGCFWHGHDCYLFKVPQTRRDFWVNKIGENRLRDAEVLRRLLNDGWRVLTIWECAIKGRLRQGDDELIRNVMSWLSSSWPEGILGCDQSRS